MLQKFVGNCPGGIGVDKKYKVRYREGGWRVVTHYRTPFGEYVCPAQPGHEVLKQMVNQVKRKVNGQVGGSFYINEYQQVLVPSSTGQYYWAGYYRKAVAFDYQGDILIGDGTRLVNDNVSPFVSDRLALGEEWTGPRHGIPYVFTRRSGRNEVYYRARVGPYEIDVYLSDFCSQAAVDKICRRLRRFKPGGRFYINEHRCLFVPLESGACVYAGKFKHLRCWFPEDSCQQAAKNYGLGEWLPND